MADYYRISKSWCPSHENKIKLRTMRAWEESELEGNFKCPNCGNILIIMNGINLKPYAFCCQCKKYFQEAIKIK